VNGAADAPCPAYGAAPSGPYTRLSTGLSNLVHKFLDPEPKALPGGIEPVRPSPAPVAPASINPPESVPAATTPPVPSATPTTAPTAAKPPKRIEPTPHHPRLAGKPMSPKLDNLL